MLQKLFVSNYALIDNLELNFETGLNIITGETGAGKSILLGALSLILGERSDKSALLDTSKKCIIEGRFSADKKILKSFFKENELDLDDEIIIRREISSEGKSRSFINDTPVALNHLKELGELLVDIHSQHETLLLNKSHFQLSVVDAFAQHENVLDEFRNKFFQYQNLLKELLLLQEEEKKSKADHDYFQFLFSELDEATLSGGEQEKIEEELRTLTHAEEIKSVLAGMIDLISGGEQNLLSQQAHLHSSVTSIKKYNSKLVEIAERLKIVSIEMKDIHSELEEISDEIIYDPKRIEFINERLNVIYKLQQKHRVKTVDELLQLKNDFENKLQNISSLEIKIVSLEKKIANLKNELKEISLKISSSRNKVIPKIESEIKKLMSGVSMPDASFKIQNNVKAEDDFSVDGIDRIQFLFSANKGVALNEIDKVASGGELSRLMLCIKASVAKLISLPTIIFDEIDTGVSGETAINVGSVLKNLSHYHQLIAITHLPQIAGRGEAHHFVFKEVVNKKTFTRVRKLNSEERTIEIAKMLGGDKPSNVAIENAKELLKY